MSITTNAKIIKARLDARFAPAIDDTVYGVEVGSYGIMYARFHEFGTEYSDKMRKAFFAKMRFNNKFKGKNARKIPVKSKGVMQFDKSGRAKIKARPFLRPAFTDNRPQILNIMRLITSPNPISKRAAFTRIGSMLEAAIVININNKDIMDTTRLEQSIAYRLLNK